MNKQEEIREGMELLLLTSFMLFMFLTPVWIVLMIIFLAWMEHIGWAGLTNLGQLSELYDLVGIWQWLEPFWPYPVILCVVLYLIFALLIKMGVGNWGGKPAIR